MDTNPIPGEDYTLFKRFYRCLGAYKRGFIEGCRPIITVDDCHLKTPFKGVMLCAIGKDPNDEMYPIASAVVQIENRDNWVWLVTNLLSDLCYPTGQGLCFISNQHKVSSNHFFFHFKLPSIWTPHNFNLINFDNIFRVYCKH